MSVKYDYPYGFCKKLGYAGLWPLAYDGESGRYKKSDMVCRCCGDGECKADCEVFASAEDVIPYEREWLLKDGMGS
jgi:hypothetical protein